MTVLKTILTVVFIIVCIILTIIVLMQEGKSAGLGAISGAAETYWGKNRGRSMEGALQKFTKWLVIGFIVIAIVLIPITNKAKSNAANMTNNVNNTTTNDNSSNTQEPTTSEDTTTPEGENATTPEEASGAGSQ